MSVTLNFDASTVEPNTRPEPVPAGWYPVVIDQSEMKPTKTGGAYLELRMTIIEGEFAGRKLFDRMNLQNSNPTAVEIAYKTLSSICRATGVIQVGTSDQLHGVPFRARATLKPAETGPDGKAYDAGNEVAEYAPMNGAQALGGAMPWAQGQPAAPQQQHPPAPPAAPSWAPPAAPAQAPAAPAPAASGPPAWSPPAAPAAPPAAGPPAWQPPAAPAAPSGPPAWQPPGTSAPSGPPAWAPPGAAAPMQGAPAAPSWQR